MLNNVATPTARREYSDFPNKRFVPDVISVATDAINVLITVEKEESSIESQSVSSRSWTRYS